MEIKSAEQNCSFSRPQLRCRAKGNFSDQLEKRVMVTVHHDFSDSNRRDRVETLQSIAETTEMEISEKQTFAQGPSTECMFMFI